MEDVLNFALERHGAQMYGHRGYVSGHLLPVTVLLQSYGFTGAAVTAALLHDVVEDTSTTVEEIKSLFGSDVADLVWAVTSEPGTSRRIRNAATYPKIRASVDALAIKLCDRIINVQECWETRNSKLFMYKKEHPEFRRALYLESDLQSILDMWKRLDNLLGWEYP